MSDARQKLRTHLAQVSDIKKATSILEWDMETMMPKDAAEDRGRVLATLGALSHAQSIDPRIIEWIEQITPDSEWEVRDLDLLRKDYLLASRVPADLVYESSEQRSKTVTAWQKAKPDSDWNKVLPELEALFDLSKQRGQIYADVLQCDLYDAQLYLSARGNTQSVIDPLFNMLKAELPPLIHQIVEKQKTWERQSYSLSLSTQRHVARELAQTLGFSFDRGRLDEAAHPFSGGYKQDSRITTRYNEANPFSGFMGVIHEVGHALYTQNLPDAWQGHPVGQDNDMSLHESQSLIFETQAGLSVPVIRYLHDLIVREDSEFSVHAPIDAFTQHLHTVQPSFIRVDADEATYPLHVVLRYEIEKELFAGTIAVRDIPELWNEKFKAFFGLDVPEHKFGCMQDIHWFWGLFGYFPTYTQGALYAAQLFAALKRDIPDVETQLGQGDFSQFTAWLTKHIHQYGQLYPAPELIERATGQAPSAQFFLDHLKARYL